MAEQDLDGAGVGAIFEQVTGEKLLAEFAERIAEPIGIEEYVPGDGRFGGWKALSWSAVSNI